MSRLRNPHCTVDTVLSTKQVELTLISEIVTCIVGKKLDTLEEALCVIKDNYDVFIVLTNGKDTTLIQNTVMKTGIINLLLQVQ